MTTTQSTVRLGTKDAAAYLGGISEATLRYWRYSGNGPRSYRLGRHTFYDVADLDAWVAEQKQATAVGGAK
jgi:DNA-binding transcriptional MerR regulator